MATAGQPHGILTERMPARRQRRAVSSGVAQVALGFGAVLLAGFILLLLPIASEGEGFSDPKTALFTAVSAICVTGLVVEETHVHWSNFGEVVILVLIQIGGLGYMAGTTVVLWALGRQLGLRDRNMLRLYYGAPSMRETLSFARSVATFALMFEAAGMVVLTIGFLAEGESLRQASWWGLFHSVSAFNNAGFNVTGSDMTAFTGSPVVLGTIAFLVIIGGLGFLPLVTLWRRRSFERLPLDHKLVFATYGALLAAGMLFALVVEWRNQDTLGALPASERPLAAFFHSANTRTAGFSALEIGEINDETKVASIGLMFVGGAAGSTAGGLKVGAFALLFAVMVAGLSGREEVSAFSKRVPRDVVQQATTLALYYVALVFGCTLLLTATAREQNFLDVMFEAVSALCTVGHSAAGTAELSSAGHFVLIGAMLVGRFGSLMLVLYMTKPRRKVSFRHPVDSVRLG